jgi:hypothetical protein
MAESLVYATARRFGATLVTGDADFAGLPTWWSSAAATDDLSLRSAAQ